MVVNQISSGYGRPEYVETLRWWLSPIAKLQLQFAQSYFPYSLGTIVLMKVLAHLRIKGQAQQKTFRRAESRRKSTDLSLHEGKLLTHYGFADKTLRWPDVIYGNHPKDCVSVDFQIYSIHVKRNHCMSLDSSVIQF